MKSGAIYKGDGFFSLCDVYLHLRHPICDLVSLDWLLDRCLTDMPFMQATNTLSLANPRFAHLAPALETDLEPFRKLQCVAGPPLQVRNTAPKRVAFWLTGSSPSPYR